MSVYYDKAKKRWRYSFNRIIAGQRTRATKLLPPAWDRSKAEKYDREETGRLYAVATGLERPEPLIGEAVRLYIEHRLPVLRNAARTEMALAHLVDYIDGRPMSALSDVSREYVSENAHLSAGTLRNRLAYLRAACKYAWRKHRLTDHDPTGQMEIPTPDNARDIRLPVAELQRKVLAKIEDREARAIFTLAFHTGSRWQSEILPRVASDVHRVAGKVLLEVGRTKNGTPRLVPVHPKARWTLQYLPFKRNSRYYYDRFRTAREAAGLPWLWVHDMRHVLATDVILRGGSLPDVAAALHHKSLLSSARYAHILTDHAERVLFRVGESKKVHTSKSPARRKLHA